MSTRRRLLYSIGSSASLAIAGCFESRGTEGFDSDRCAAFPGTAASRCGEGGAGLLSIESTLVGDEETVGLTLRATSGRVTVDPKAYSYFQWSEHGWRSRATQRVDRDRAVELASGEELEWVVSFEWPDEQRHTEAGKQQIDLAPLSPSAENSLAVPAWEEGTFVSYGVRFRRDR